MVTYLTRFMENFITYTARESGLFLKKYLKTFGRQILQYVINAQYKAKIVLAPMLAIVHHEQGSNQMFSFLTIAYFVLCGIEHFLLFVFWFTNRIDIIFFTLTYRTPYALSLYRELSHIAGNLIWTTGKCLNITGEQQHC